MAIIKKALPRPRQSHISARSRFAPKVKRKPSAQGHVLRKPSGVKRSHATKGFSENNVCSVRQSLFARIPDADNAFSLHYLYDKPPMSEALPLVEEEKWETLPNWISLPAERKTSPLPLCFFGHPLCPSIANGFTSCYKCSKKPIPKGETILWCKTCGFWSICEECITLPRQLSLQDDPLFHGCHDPCLVTWSLNSHLESSRGTVIICPGGNYEFLVVDEGQPVVEWLAKHGIYSCVLRYRLLPHYRLDDALDDLAAAIARIRRVRAGPVVGLGFSAGGHLLASLAIRNAASEKTTKSSGTTLGLDGQMLAYAGIDGSDWLDPWNCGFHDWERCLAAAPSLLGRQPALLGGPGFAAPPSFLVYSVYDTTCPPKKHGDRYAKALDAAGVPYTYMRADYGEHGFCIYGSWAEKGLKWLNYMGVGLNA